MLKSITDWLDAHKVRHFVASEYIVLIAIAIASGCVWLFFNIADEVMEGDTHEVDQAILDMFRVADDPSQIIGPVWLHEAVRDLTALGSATVLTIIIFVVAISLWMIRERVGAILIVVSTAVGALVSNTLKLGFSRERPDFETVYATLTNSFPSGHSMLSAVTFLTLGALLARIVDSWRLKVFFFVVAVLLTVGVGVSRVFLGVHFPSDVIAGWALGAAWALLWSAVAFFLQRRGKI